MKKYKKIIEIKTTKETWTDLTKQAKSLTKDKKLIPLTRDYLILSELKKEYAKELKRKR